MKQITTLAAVVLLLGASFGQNKTRDQSTFTFTVSGVTQVMVDGVGTQYNQWEVVPAGSPASLTVTIAGCIRGGTCSATLATSSGTSAQILNTTGVYDYYNVTASWTGGTRVAVTVNRTATLALSGGGGVGSSAFASLTSGTNNSAAMVATTGASLSPASTANYQPLGQISSTSWWIDQAPGAVVPTGPTLTGALTGGALAPGNVVYVKITFVGLASIVPSAEIKITMNAANNCASGAVCSVTVNMPTECQAGNLPSGATGCTVWDSPSTQTEKQQAASNACVNITTSTCVIGTPAAGSSLSNPVTTGLTPPSLQVNPNRPNNIIPTIFMQKGDSNFWPIGGVDVSGLNFLPQPDGTLTLFDRMYFNDKGSSGGPPISNVLVSISHMAGATTGTGTTTDDRALGVLMQNANTATPAFEQYLGQYTEIWAQNNAMTCNPIGSQAGESCIAAGRFVATELRSSPTNTLSGMEGVAGVAGMNVATGNIGSCVGACYKGVRGEAYEGTVTAHNGGGNFFAGVQGEFNGSASNTNGNGTAFYAMAPSTRFATHNYSYYGSSQGSNAADWDLWMEGTAGTPANGQNFLRGQLYLPKILSNSGVEVPFIGSLNATGSYQTTKLGTAPQPGTITNLGTPGAVTYTYAVVCKDGMGNTSNGGSVRSTTTGNATLDGTNKNQFQVVIPYAAVGCDVYRTASGGSPSSTGKISTIAINDPQAQISGAGTVFQDTGLAGDNTVMPAVDTTGGAKFQGYVNQAMNTVNVAADQVFNADTALHNITSLSWNLGVLAGTYNFTCTLIYSQATAAVANAFGIQSATIAPTNIEADGMVFTNTTAVTSGVLPTLTTTTATNIVSFTPGATATNFIAILHGQIVEPANTGGNTINIMALTGAAADALTIRKGSSCQLN